MSEDRRQGRGSGEQAAQGPPPEAPGARDLVALFDLVPGADGAARFVLATANETALAALGRTPASVAGTGLDDLLPPAAALTLLDPLRAAAGEVATERVRVALDLPSGRFEGEACAVPLPGPDGGCARVVLTLTPAPAPADREPPRVGVFRSEPGIGAVFVSDELLAMSGLTPEQALGYGWLDAVHPDDRPGVERHLGVWSGRTTTLDLAFRLVRPGGATRQVRVHVVPLLGDGGSVTGGIGVVEDVTEHAAAAGLLEGWYRSVVEHAPDLVAVGDAEGRITYASPSTARILGHDPEALVGTRFADHATRADADRLAAAMAEVAGRPGETVAFEVPVRHRDGRPVALECRATNLLEDPEVRGVVVHARDVTHRRSAEAARQRSEATLRAIVQHSPLGVAAADEEGRVQLWNRAAERILGWPAAEVIGGPIPYADAAAREASRRGIDRVFAGETIEEAEVERSRADGRPITMRFSAAPVRDRGGRVVAAVSVFADGTERKRVEEALRASEERFRALVQHASDFMLLLDARLRILWASPASAEFLGRTVVELTGNRPPFLGHPDDIERVDRIVRRLIASPGSVERFAYRQQRHDGEWRHLEVVATNLLDDPGVAGIVMNLSDATERVAALGALRENEQLLSAVVENASDLITILDPDGTLRYSSPVARTLLGYEPGTHYGESVFDLVHPDDRERVVRLWVENAERRGVYPPVEVRLRRADGTWLDCEVVANNLVDDPDMRGVVMTTRDISARKAAEAVAHQTEERYRSIVEDQTELVCRYLPDTTLTFVNRAFADFYGASPDELVGSRLIDLYAPADQAVELARLAAFGPGHTVETTEDWETAGDGSLRWCQWTDRAFLDAAGRLAGFQSVGRDMTEHRRAALLTAHQAEILELVARGVPLAETLDAVARAVEEQSPGLRAAVWLLDEGGTVLRHGAAPTLPDAVVAALDGVRVGTPGLPTAVAVERGAPVQVADFASDQTAPPMRDLAYAHGLRACWSTPLFAVHGGDVLGALTVYGAEPGLPPPEHQQVVDMLGRLAAIAVDRKQFEERLAHQSLHDPLTGLPNRTLFLDRLGLALARSDRTRTEAAVLFLDLDRFKLVNDSLGHDAGDELLVAMARRLEGVVRPGDTVARFGGDEFTVLCEDLAPDEARSRAADIATRLLESITAPFPLRGTETFVSGSIGIALGRDSGMRPEALLRDADAAMYRAKDRGRNRFEMFDDAMREQLVSRHATENALHRAIERGELRVFYQPVVSLTEGRCVGAEALVRWQHPERGLVPPLEFIPLAEDTGLIHELGAWVLEEAAREAAQWALESPTPFVVAVNLSARQLARPDLVETVAAVLERTGAPPAGISFEITESVLMEDADSTAGAVERIKALGVGLTIDDFGTGYSSLGYLKRFPVDAVKVDRSFVDGLGNDSGDTAIVTAVIGLAHALGLRVVGEGVELVEQLQGLLALGCDEAQGYFFAPPQPVQDLRRLLGRRRRWRPPGARLMAPARGALGRRRGPDLL